MSEKVRENRLRRQAQRLGYGIIKSRARQLHLNNRGLYQIIDIGRNFVIAGADYDLSLDDVAEWLDHFERNGQFGSYPKARRAKR